MGCHSVNEGQVLFGPSLYHVTTPPHPRETPTQIREILKNGKNKMPSFDGKLEETQVNDVIAYLRTL